MEDHTQVYTPMTSMNLFTVQLNPIEPVSAISEKRQKFSEVRLRLDWIELAVSPHSSGIQNECIHHADVFRLWQMLDDDKLFGVISCLIK